MSKLAANQTYRNGEVVEYIGTSMELHGATFYHIRVVADSHRIGTQLVTQEKPPVIAGA
jgi:hypothetical protein